MAIYHCSVQVIGRNTGRSSVAAAAYRAGEDLVNEYDGIEHDFTKKNWIEFTEIILPENAPEAYRDRSNLWNAVEFVEKTKDAQLAREFELALPIELTKEQQIETVRQFVQENLTAQGMVADIAIHSPPVTNDRHQAIDINGNVTRNIDEMQFINPHAHILCTVRPMDEQGRWEKKSEVEYLCKKDGEERAFTASEYYEAKKEGWEKQYRYYDGKKKIYFTLSEAAEKDLKRVNRTPKTTPYGRKNKTVEYWNSKDRIFEWRQSWEKIVNDTFASIQSEIRIDSRSFKNQGREDEIPSLHMGTAAVNMEKRADREIREGKVVMGRSDIGNINCQIKEHNQFIRELKAKLDKIAEKTKDFAEMVAKKLEAMRAKLIGNKYEETFFVRKYHYMKAAIAQEGQMLERYQAERTKIEKANQRSAEQLRCLDKELKACSSFQIRKKADIQKQMQEEQEKIEYRNEYRQQIARMCRIYAEEDLNLKNVWKNHLKKEKDLGRISKIMETIKADSEQIKMEYQATIKEVTEESKQEVSEKRAEARLKAECMVKKKLYEKHGEAFAPELYESVRKSVDQEMGLSEKAKNIDISLKKAIVKSRYK